MTEKDEQDKIEGVAHHLHEKYRASGIALCISLAALATSETWWFYNFLQEVIDSECSFQKWLYALIIISALAIIYLSFDIQYKHYLGTKNHARAYGLLMIKKKRTIQRYKKIGKRVTIFSLLLINV